LVPRRTVPRKIFKDFVEKAIVDVYLVIFILLIIGTKILSSVLTLSAGHT